MSAPPQLLAHAAHVGHGHAVWQRHSAAHRSQRPPCFFASDDGPQAICLIALLGSNTQFMAMHAFWERGGSHLFEAVFFLLLPGVSFFLIALSEKRRFFSLARFLSTCACARAMAASRCCLGDVWGEGGKSGERRCVWWEGMSCGEQRRRASCTAEDVATDMDVVAATSPYAHKQEHGYAFRASQAQAQARLLAVDNHRPRQPHHQEGLALCRQRHRHPHGHGHRDTQAEARTRARARAQSQT